MKQIMTLITIATLFVGTTYGQVTEQTSMLSLGEQNAFVMEHSNADDKMVVKIMEKAIKEYGKVKRNKKAKEWNCLQCDVPGISSPANVYFKVAEGKSMTRSYLFVDDGSQFISTSNNADAAKRIIKQLTYIGNDVTREVIKKELEREEDNLKDLNKEQAKLEKKNEDYHEDIEDYKKKISEAEKKIEKNLQSQEDKKMQIEKQGRVIEDVTMRLNNVGTGAGK